MDDERIDREIGGIMRILTGIFAVIMIIVGAANGHDNSILHASMILGGSLMICTALYSAKK